MSLNRDSDPALHSGQIAQCRSVLLPGQETQGRAATETMLSFEFNAAAGDLRPGVIATGVQALRPDRYVETWSAPGPARKWLQDGVGVSLCGDYMGVHGTWHPAGNEPICLGTERLYHTLLALLQAHGFNRLARAWHFVPQINLGDGDEETYRQFCLGRANALDARGVATEDLPAATAVGVAPGCPMTIAIIGTRVPTRHLENPRQVEAYNYPRRYGPRGPSFSRGTLLGTAGRDALLLTSGTASIRGHESIHCFDALSQVDETMTNLEQVLAQATSVHGDTEVKHPSGNIYRVYLRDPALLDGVAQRILRYPVSASQLVFLQADICREELSVEIEGVQYL